MAAAKRVRWDCPNGCAGVLGPRRPRADSTVRFCLACSAEAGHLVRRSAPALESDRLRRQKASATRAERQRQRERERERQRRIIIVREQDGSIAELDALEALLAMTRLPSIAEARRANRGLEPGRDLPLLEIRRSRTKPYSTGRAWGSCKPQRITLTIGIDQRREEIEELILHELVHLAAPRREKHGAGFRRLLVMAAREWWPGLITARADSRPRVYALDSLIVEQAKGG